MDLIKMRFADWLPVPFEVATVMTTSLTTGCAAVEVLAPRSWAEVVMIPSRPTAGSARRLNKDYHTPIPRRSNCIYSGVPNQELSGS